MTSSTKKLAPWSRTNRPPIKVRTLNIHEVETVMQLEEDGWEVIKRGIPDFIAVKGDKIRFLEVKNSPTSNLKPDQRKVAAILKKFFGIEVELVRPPLYTKKKISDFK